MPGGRVRDSLGWLVFAPTFLGVRASENLNAKEKHVGANADEVLDRGSIPLTSIKKHLAQGSPNRRAFAICFFCYLPDERQI